MHDDRFYVLALLANELHELRDDDNQNKHRGNGEKDETILSLFTSKQKLKERRCEIERD